jgi:phospholipid-translocating ATPase
MSDGFYQSLMCFFLPYLLYSPGNFQRSDGLGIDDRPRVGVLVASAAVIASNTYILLNTYRWDWLTVLINALSSLLIFFWTGIYSSLVSSAQFYKSASEVYGTLSYWTVLLVTVMICLLPRFVIKASQKVFFPFDVDIIREQAIMGKFKTVENIDGPTAKAETAYFRLTGSDYSTGPSAVASQDEPRPQETVAMDENHQAPPGFSMNRKLSSINSYDLSSPGTVSPADSMNIVPQTFHSPLGRPYNASSNVV